MDGWNECRGEQREVLPRLRSFGWNECRGAQREVLPRLRSFALRARCRMVHCRMAHHCPKVSGMKSFGQRPGVPFYTPVPFIANRCIARSTHLDKVLQRNHVAVPAHALEYLAQVHNLNLVEVRSGGLVAWKWRGDFIAHRCYRCCCYLAAL